MIFIKSWGGRRAAGLSEEHMGSRKRGQTRSGQGNPQARPESIPPLLLYVPRRSVLSSWDARQGRDLLVCKCAREVCVMLDLIGVRVQHFRALCCGDGPDVPRDVGETGGVLRAPLRLGYRVESYSAV